MSSAEISIKLSMISILLSTDCVSIAIVSIVLSIVRLVSSIISIELCMVSRSSANKSTLLSVVQIFAKRAIMGEYFQEKGWGVDKIISWIDKKIKDKSDWFLSAEEAVYYGFADGVLGNKGFETINKIRSGKKYKGNINGGIY